MTQPLIIEQIAKAKKQKAERESAEAAQLPNSDSSAPLDLTNAEALKLLPDDEFEPLHAAALAAQASLEDVAANADSAARKAQGDFAASPTAATLTEREIAQQLATNAQRAATEHAEQIMPLRMENTRRCERRELLELRALADTRGFDAEMAGKVAELVERFDAELRGHLADLRAVYGQRNAIIPKLNMLEVRAGNGAPYQSILIERPISIISKSLHERFGAELSMNGMGNYQIHTWADGGNNDKPIVEFTARLRPYAKRV